MLCLRRHQNERVAIFLRGEFVCWVTFNGRSVPVSGAQFKLIDVLASLGFDGEPDAKFIREEAMRPEDWAAVPEKYLPTERRNVVPHASA